MYFFLKSSFHAGENYPLACDCKHSRCFFCYILPYILRITGSITVSYAEYFCRTSVSRASTSSNNIFYKNIVCIFGEMTYLIFL